MNVAECKNGKVLSQKYWYWYWQYFLEAVLVLVILFAKVLLLVLTIVFTSIVKIPAQSRLIRLTEVVFSKGTMLSVSDKSESVNEHTHTDQ